VPFAAPERLRQRSGRRRRRQRRTAASGEIDSQGGGLLAAAHGEGRDPEAAGFGVEGGVSRSEPLSKRGPDLDRLLDLERARLEAAAYEPDPVVAEPPPTATGRPRVADHGVDAIVVALTTGIAWWATATPRADSQWSAATQKRRGVRKGRERPRGRSLSR
jgi:hypothetical protein